MKTLEDLVPKLIEKTSDGSISWSPGAGASQFKTTFGKFRIDVWKWNDEADDTDGISLGLKLGDSADYTDVLMFDSYSSRFGRLDELYSMARRSGLRIDRIIQEADDELDKTTPF